jgi:hypothetical protein
VYKHNRSEMVAVLGPNEALPYYIHTYIHNTCVHLWRSLCRNVAGEAGWSWVMRCAGSTGSSVGIIISTGIRCLLAVYELSY